MKKASQRAGGYGIGFFAQCSSIRKKQVDIKLFIHTYFKRVEKYHFIHLLFLID